MEPWSFLPQILPIYAEILRRLAEAGAAWVQIDEPILALDLGEVQRAALNSAYAALGSVGPKLMVASYFGALGDNLDLALSLPVAGLHLDLVRAPEQVEALLAAKTDKTLSLGLIDGRNVWKADLAAALERAKFVAARHDSFLQTAEVRRARADHRKGILSDGAYEAFLKAETESCIRRQEALGLDMLAHGEFERNDMVEYFGEHLSGFAFTRMAWAQSYGSRCVKPR